VYAVQLHSPPSPAEYSFQLVSLAIGLRIFELPPWTGVSSLCLSVGSMMRKIIPTRKLKAPKIGEGVETAAKAVQRLRTQVMDVVIGIWRSFSYTS
jgi:hypothetical protein